MPRRNYATGRSRPRTNDGDALRHLAEQFARRQPAPRKDVTPATPVTLTHREHCQTPNVHTFTGKLGDLMARCRNCNAVQVAQ